MGQNKRKIIEEDLVPNSWVTKKCNKCGKDYKVNKYAKPDNDLGYCDECYEEIYPKK